MKREKKEDKNEILGRKENARRKKNNFTGQEGRKIIKKKSNEKQERKGREIFRSLSEVRKKKEII